MARRSRAVDAVLASFTALCLAILGLLSHVDVANASHPTWDWRHLGSVHSSTLDEDYCLETTSTTRSFSTMASNIRKALWLDAPDDQQWDATGFDSSTWEWRVWFVPQDSIPCQSMSQSQRGPIEIEYWLRDSPQSNYAVPDTSYIDSKGHSAASYYYVYLYAPWVAGEQYPTYYRHQLNHETGHAVGMADGDWTCPTGGSVMHSTAYGCGSIDREWPSAGDKSGLDSRTAN